MADCNISVHSLSLTHHIWWMGILRLLLEIGFFYYYKIFRNRPGTLSLSVVCVFLQQTSTCSLPICPSPGFPGWRSADWSVCGEEGAGLQYHNPGESERGRARAVLETASVRMKVHVLNFSSFLNSSFYWSISNHDWYRMDFLNQFPLGIPCFSRLERAQLMCFQLRLGFFVGTRKQP